jgi:RNA polymerase sigma-70 factor (ECF subfamily)
MKPRTLEDFNTLVEQYTGEIYSYLWRMLRDPQDAEDVLQETFLRAFKSFPGLRDDSNFRAWLYKIATNAAYTQLKQRTRRESHFAVFIENIQGTNPPPRELILAVLTAIESLPSKQQASLMLRKYQNLSYPEIGNVLNCSPDSARANVYQALKRLRAEFTEADT